MKCCKLLIGIQWLNPIGNRWIRLHIFAMQILYVQKLVGVKLSRVFIYKFSERNKCLNNVQFIQVFEITFSSACKLLTAPMIFWWSSLKICTRSNVCNLSQVCNRSRIFSANPAILLETRWIEINSMIKTTKTLFDFYWHMSSD